MFLSSDQFTVSDLGFKKYSWVQQGWSEYQPKADKLLVIWLLTLQLSVGCARKLLLIDRRTQQYSNIQQSTKAIGNNQCFVWPCWYLLLAWPIPTETRDHLSPTGGMSKNWPTSWNRTVMKACWFLIPFDGWLSGILWMLVIIASYWQPFPTLANHNWKLSTNTKHYYQLTQMIATINHYFPLWTTSFPLWTTINPYSSSLTTVHHYRY